MPHSMVAGQGQDLLQGLRQRSRQEIQKVLQAMRLGHHQQNQR
jgi:hypothetical protein